MTLAVSPPFPEILRPWLAVSSLWLAFKLLAAALAAAGVLVLLWRRFGRAPRRNRAYQRVQELLKPATWQEAHAAVLALERLGAPTPQWQERLRAAEGECQRLAADAALAAGMFEEAIDYYQHAAPLLGRDGASDCARVMDAMLAEVRRAFAMNDANTDRLIERVLAVEPQCAEALFWQGMLRAAGRTFDAAQASLERSVALLELSPQKAVDPYLYLGVLALRAGRTHDALRHLSEAYRTAPDCPFVLCQLGLALAASGKDGPAVRPLQRALSLTALGQWTRAPRRAWIDGWPAPQPNGQHAPPQAVSFVRRLAEQHEYRCPLLGEVSAQICQGHSTLAEVFTRLDRHAEAAESYQIVLHERPPTLPTVRGLGLALARLKRFDQAYKHLRTAYELEPSHHQTAGYLALCAARGKPNRPEDKASNIAWALKLMRRFDIAGDAEWARLYGAIAAEARAHDVSISTADQECVCAALASVAAADALAAGAYEELARTVPEAVADEQAWLYCRAAQMHNVGTPHGLRLFARTCGAAAARAYFHERQWDFDAVEYTYLQRLADAPNHPVRADFQLTPAQHELLLARSRVREESGNLAEAFTSVEILLHLSPDHPRALDRLAALYFRRNEPSQALALLSRWRAVELCNPVPLVRQAIIHQRVGDAVTAIKAIEQAMLLSTGKLCAAIAFVGARLAVAECYTATTAPAKTAARVQALTFLHTCLELQPDHPTALRCLASLHVVAGDTAALAELAPAMRQPDVADAEFHYLSSISHLAANDPQYAAEAAERARQQAPVFSVESAYLIGVARMRLHQESGAEDELHKVADANAGSPTADYARALLGQIYFHRREYAKAVDRWSAVPPEHRATLGLEQPLRQTMIHEGLVALQTNRYADAIERFRQASHCRELLGLALVKEAQRQLYAEPIEKADEAYAADLSENGVPAVLEPEPAETAVWLLKQAIDAGCGDTNVAYLLALAHKRLNQITEARAVLRALPDPDAFVLLQAGLLALDDVRGGLQSPIHEAEQQLTLAWAKTAGPTSKIADAVGSNLFFARLSLGMLEEATALLPRLRELAADGSAWRNWYALLHSCLAQNRVEQYIRHLSGLSLAEEQALLSQLRALGRLDVVTSLLKTLLAARPDSLALREADMEADIVRGKKVLERGEPTEARLILTRLLRDKGIAQPTRVALLNLLGCCACLVQNGDDGAQYFLAALDTAGHDPRLHQNLALAYEALARSEAYRDLSARADQHWHRYLDALDGRLPVPAGQPDYRDRLAFECLSRLGRQNTERENWESALVFLQRAHYLRPDDADVLERLFHLHGQLGHVEDARQTLQRLKQLRADEPQLEMYELEFMEINGSDDVDRVLSEIERIRKRYPEDTKIAERTAVVLDRLVDFIQRLSRQFGDQIGKTGRSLSRLPSYQINWVEVNNFLRDMRFRLHRLRRTIEKCLLQGVSDAQERQLQKLQHMIDGQLEMCRTMGG